MFCWYDRYLQLWLCQICASKDETSRVQDKVKINSSLRLYCWLGHHKMSFYSTPHTMNRPRRKNASCYITRWSVWWPQHYKLNGRSESANQQAQDFDHSNTFEENVIFHFLKTKLKYRNPFNTFPRTCNLRAENLAYFHSHLPHSKVKSKMKFPTKNSPPSSLPT